MSHEASFDAESDVPTDDIAQLQSRSPRSGIRARLFIAFAAVACFTLISGAVAWYSYRNVESNLNEVTERNIPAMHEALSLAAKSANLTAAVPMLATATSEDERTRFTAACGRPCFRRRRSSRRKPK